MTREEALKKIRQMSLPKETMEILEALAPELAESEDERIRKRLIEYFEGFRMGNAEVKWEGLTVQEVLAWLEKQKEQKPEHFELKAGKWYICHRAFCARADHLTVKEGERFQCEKDGIVKGFVIKEPEKYFKECSTPEPMEKEQKSAEWSEEDESFLDSIEEAIHSYYDLNHAPQYDYWLEEKLKSLRPVSKESLQPHWKPSEEQMESLAYAIQVLNSNPHPKSAKAYQDLQTLYKNIKYGN